MIPKDTIKRAKAILTSQSFVPMSPAVVTADGNLCLCGAASLALAGVEGAFGGAAADEFLSGICFVSSKGLEDVFERLGWAATLCATMRNCNDAASPDDRLNLVIAKLESLAVS